MKIQKVSKNKDDTFTPGITARFFGAVLVFFGNLVYGKEPSYLKFRSVEIIARVPYQSWTSACFTLLTCFFKDEARALELSKSASYAEFAQANETMHVVVISQLAANSAPAHFVRYTLIPVIFSFFYFWFSYILYLIHPRISYELNYLFEDHAESQYTLFLVSHEQKLKEKTMASPFLLQYGRSPKNEYEFFVSVRDDETQHKNASRDAAMRFRKNKV